MTAGAIAAGAALLPLTDASAVQQQVRAVTVQRPAPRPAAPPRETFQRTGTSSARWSSIRWCSTMW